MTDQPSQPSPPAEPRSPASRGSRGNPSRGRQPRPPAPAADSAGSSTESSAASFIADAGPGFDHKQAPPAPVQEPDAAEIIAAEEWDEPRIRELLTLQGEITHGVLRVGPDELDDTWLHTERDLRAIAPPLTRILNRYDATRALAAAGDEALLAAAVVRYGARNVTKRRRLLAARAADEPQPVTGAPAPENTGPEADPQWQRVHDAPPAITPKGARR